jgi:large subunit ribosomal protein L23
MDKFLIKHPLVSEKAVEGSKRGAYVFLVDRRATKPEVAKAVRVLYKVEVTSVRIVNMKPKRRRLGQTVGVKPGYKKAIVTLKKGEKLDILPH